MVQKSDLRIDEGEVLLIRKPVGWTSFDVVNRVRHLFGIRKVGHAGTLDPLASGLLIVCTGKKTKEISTFVGLEKEYDSEMTLGARTASFDAGTPILETRGTDGLTEQMVREVLEEFVGPQTQVPPMWSALKVGGRRLYKYAREGTEVVRKPREIFIRSIVPTEIRIPVVRFTVTCSKGTYVRSLVHDLGERLGCLGYLSALERTRIGEFRVAEALTIEDLSMYRFARSAGEA